MEVLLKNLDEPLYIAAGGALLGIISHLTYFIHGEHHLLAPRYGQIALISPFLLTLLCSRIPGTTYLASIGNALTWELSFLCGLWTSMLIYRGLFHRLRRFPGPPSLKWSKFFHVSQIFTKLDYYKRAEVWHETYGDFVRTGPGELSIVHPEAMEAIFGTRSLCTKGIMYDVGHPRLSMVQARDNALHDRRRKIWEKGFSIKALDAYQTRVKGLANVLVDQIASFGGKPLNATRWFNYYSFDVMGHLAFGKSFDMLRSGTQHEAIAILTEGLRPSGQFSCMPWIMVLMLAVPGVGAGFKRWLQFCEDQVDARKQLDVKEKDVMSYLLDGEPMSNDPAINRLWDLGDSQLLIVAGSDTTAITLTYMFYNLARDPTLVQRLRQELAEYVKEDGNYDVKELAKAKFLNAIINETLRLHHPIPSGLSRLTPPEGIMIGDRRIPGNILVNIPYHTLGRSPQAYKRPLEFLPERWIDEPELILNKSAFAPFAIGKFNCIGKNLALAELRTVTADIVSKFDVAFAPNENGHKILHENLDCFTYSMQSLMLTFTPRK